MTVTLRPEQAQVVGETIRAGLIGTGDEVVDVGTEAIRQCLESSKSSDSARTRQQQIDAAAERLLNFGEKYHFSLGDMTIKELVNEGRR
jgi:hypothetical protein